MVSQQLLRVQASVVLVVVEDFVWPELVELMMDCCISGQ
jgi:hypothetical protein